jgi:signal transduction histidine kinase
VIRTGEGAGLSRLARLGAVVPLGQVLETDHESYQLVTEAIRLKVPATIYLSMADSDRVVEARVVPADGRSLVLLRDITDRAMAQRRLEESLRDRVAFLASVSHELRTPLTDILGYASLLADPERAASLDNTAEVIDVIADAARDMSAIVDDLLVASRMELDEVRVMAAPVDVEEEVRRVVADARHMLKGTPAVEVHEPGVWAIGDSHRVRQILRNLLINVVRYGGSLVRMEVGGDGQRCQVRVADDGSAIPPEEAPRLFEPVARFYRHEGQPGSIGIGLSTSGRLARLMEGELSYLHLAGESALRLGGDELEGLNPPDSLGRCSSALSPTRFPRRTFVAWWAWLVWWTARRRPTWSHGCWPASPPVPS